MNTKAIIFDKDGTLIDFDSFWVPVTRRALADVLQTLKIEDVSVEELMTAFGVEDGISAIDGVLCYGTYGEMGEECSRVLQKYGYDVSAEELTELTGEAYPRYSAEGTIQGACDDICGVLEEMKSRGLRLAVYTADRPAVTKKVLSSVGIEDYFDAIYSDDGRFPAKPAPDSINDFCEKMGFDKSEVVMVGDTLHDMHAAKNAGIRSIGVAKGERNTKLLATETDTVVPDISYVLGCLEEE